MALHPRARCHYCDGLLPTGDHYRFCSTACARDYAALEPSPTVTAAVQAIWDFCDGLLPAAQVAAAKAQAVPPAPPPPPPEDDLTAAVQAIWDRYEADVRWANARRQCGDLHRYKTGLQSAWARCERAFAALGDPPPVNANRVRPELRLVAGDKEVA